MIKKIIPYIGAGIGLGLLLFNRKSPVPAKTYSNWKQSTNIYEVNIRQYTAEGTFAAFQEHLPRIKDMGVQILWLMPITPIAEKEKKGSLGSPYAAQDYTSVNPEFGSLQDFKNLVNEAHQLGFKIIIDWVANHTGWDHTWTRCNPEFYKKNPETGDFQTASGMADIIELDYTNAELRLAMIDAMKFWLRECEIDGFRCDLSAWVTVDFWKEARAAIDPQKKLFWLGEYDELDNPEYGEVFDASYSWNWMLKTREFHDSNLPLQELKDLLFRYAAIGDQTMRAWFTSNHDENTWNGTEYEKYGPFALPLAVFSVTWNGVPLIYSGQEIPLINKRLEFFERDTIHWPIECKLHDFYRRLLALKANNPALNGGNSKASTEILTTSADAKIFAYSRKNSDAEVLTFLNFSKEPVEFEVLNLPENSLYRNIFSGQEVAFNSNQKMALETGGYLVYEKLASRQD